MEALSLWLCVVPYSSSCSLSSFRDFRLSVGFFGWSTGQSFHACMRTSRSCCGDLQEKLFQAALLWVNLCRKQIVACEQSIDLCRIDDGSINNQDRLLPPVGFNADIAHPLQTIFPYLLKKRERLL